MRGKTKKKSAEVIIIICLAGSLFLNDVQPVLECEVAMTQRGGNMRSGSG